MNLFHELLLIAKCSNDKLIIEVTLFGKLISWRFCKDQELTFKIKEFKLI